MVRPLVSTLEQVLEEHLHELWWVPIQAVVAKALRLVSLVKLVMFVPSQVSEYYQRKTNSWIPRFVVTLPTLDEFLLVDVHNIGFALGEPLRLLRVR